MNPFGSPPSTTVKRWLPTGMMCDRPAATRTTSGSASSLARVASSSSELSRSAATPAWKTTNWAPPSFKPDSIEFRTPCTIAPNATIATTPSATPSTVSVVRSGWRIRLRQAIAFRVRADSSMAAELYARTTIDSRHARGSTSILVRGYARAQRPRRRAIPENALNQSLANIFGLLLSGALLICAFLVPRILPSTPAAGSPAALRAAEEARRQVAAFNEGLSRLAAQQDLEALKKSDPEKLVSFAQGELEQRTKPIADFIERARRTDRKSGLAAIRVTPASGDASLIRAGADSLDKQASENAARLKAALTAAKQAVAEGSSAVGVNAMIGLAHDVHARDMLAG